MNFAKHRRWKHTRPARIRPCPGTTTVDLFDSGPFPLPNIDANSPEVALFRKFQRHIPPIDLIIELVARLARGPRASDPLFMSGEARHPARIGARRTLDRAQTLRALRLLSRMPWVLE